MVAHSHLHFLRDVRPSLVVDQDGARMRHRLTRLVIYPSAVLPRHSLKSITNMPKVKRKAVTKSKTPAKSKSNPRTKANPTAKAKATADINVESEPVFFRDPETSSEGGFLSPWWRSRFEVKGVVYMKAGQYIMAEKARAFGDKVSI